MNKFEEILMSEDAFLFEETIDGIPCNIGYIKKFRWKWMAIQMNTFIIMGNNNGPVSRSKIESFSTACFKYAIKNNKGWPRGIQAAVASIAILQGSTFDADAIEFCEKLSKKHWSAFEIPVLYNPADKSYIRFKKNPLWGAVFMPYFKKTIDSLMDQVK